VIDTTIFTRHLDLTPLKGRRAGLTFCPFHGDRTPSLSVDLDAGIFHCFGCGLQGGVLAFQEELLRRGIIEAREIGRRQPWAREPARTLAEVQERIKASRRQIEALRAGADDSPVGWAKLAAAADLERVVLAAEEEVDGVVGW
jgi:hypothetical protein